MTAIEQLTSAIIGNNADVMTSTLSDIEIQSLIEDNDTYSDLLAFAQQHHFQHAADALIAARQQPYSFDDSLHLAIKQENSVLVAYYATQQSDAFNKHVLEKGDRLCQIMGDHIFSSDKAMPRVRLCLPFLTATHWETLLESDEFYECIVKFADKTFFAECASTILTAITPLIEDIESWSYEAVKFTLKLTLYADDLSIAKRIISLCDKPNNVSSLVFDSIMSRKNTLRLPRYSHALYQNTGSFSEIMSSALKSIKNLPDNAPMTVAECYLAHLMNEKKRRSPRINRLVSDLLIPYACRGGDVIALIKDSAFSMEDIQQIYSLSATSSKAPEPLVDSLLEMVFSAYNDIDSAHYQSSRLQFFASEVLEQIAEKVTWEVEDDFYRYCKLADIIGCVAHWLPEKRKNSLLNIKANLETQKHYCMALYALLQVPLGEVFNGKIEHSSGTIKALATKYEITDLLAHASQSEDTYAVNLLMKSFTK